MAYLPYKLKIGLLSSCSVILISCASSSGEISSTYVSPTQFRAFNCDQLSLELTRLNTRKSELVTKLDEKASDDEVITAVSLVLFWPAAFALGGNQAQEAEYARLKGEYDAVLKVGIEKNCKLDPNEKFVSPLVANYGTSSQISVSVYDFYGDAEDEINSGNTDRNLWAKALIEAEGEETIRKAKYIELRANQLYIEKAGLTEVLDPNDNVAAQSINLSGTYIVNVSNDDLNTHFPWIFNSKKQFKIELRQEDKRVTGSFLLKSSGTIEGDLVGDKFSFYWYTRNCSKGRGQWTVSPDGFNLSGTWSCNTYTIDGDWEAQKL